MKMSPRNLILIIGAVIIGLVLGLAYPMIGLVLLIPVMAFVAIVFLRNKGGAEADETTAAAARAFTAQNGKAAIYVMRKGFVAGQQGMNITIDDAMTTQFRTGRFVKADVDPGEHTIIALMASQTKGTATTHTIALAAGDCVLLDAKINMGALQGSVELVEFRDPAEARGKLAGLKLVEWSTPE